MTNKLWLISVVSGQTLSKEIGMMFLSLVAILALDCHADQRGADADSKLSIKLKLKFSLETLWKNCLLYTSDAADE